MGPIQSASRCARYSLTVTTCTPSPVSALRYAASVDISVLPSPVRISAMRPSFSVSPPMSCTSKWRILSVRRAASRTTAKASGARSLSASPAARRLRNSSVLALEGLVAQCLQRGLECGRLAHRRLIATDDAIVATAEEPRQKIEHLRILARNCNAGQPLRIAAPRRPGRYSTDRPERTVLVSARGPAGQWAVSGPARQVKGTEDIDGRRRFGGVFRRGDR